MNWLPTTPQQWFSTISALAAIFLPIIARYLSVAKTDRRKMHDDNVARLEGINMSLGNLNTKVALQNGRVGRLEERVDRLEDTWSGVERRKRGRGGERGPTTQ